MVYAAATINCAEANGWTREADAALGWSLERWKNTNHPNCNALLVMAHRKEGHFVL